MNPKFALALTTMAAVCGGSNAIFFTTAAGTAATGIALTSGVGITSAGALALGGLAILKVAAIAGLALAASSRRRGKRAAEMDEAPFALIAQVEPEQCYRRLICDLATGQMPKSDNDVILSLFNEDTPISSPKFEFATAAKLGRLAKDIKACEIRYHCALDGQQIGDLLSS